MAMRIVADSSSDLFALSGIDYRTVPLKVMFGGNEYVDEIGCDCEKMVLALQEHDGPSTTSCPNVQEWLDAFEGADEIFVVTISSNLSGSYAAAEMARAQYLQDNPTAKIALFDSKATGPVERLIIEKLCEGIREGNAFERIAEETHAYQLRLCILYSLESLNNLARNGRVNVHVAHIASMLNIRAIGHASDRGTVELLHKCRGEKRALKTIVDEMASRGCVGGTVHIDHCLNERAAQTLAALIAVRIPRADVRIHPCGALCSYYADKGGLIIGYEVEQSEGLDGVQNREAAQALQAMRTARKARREADKAVAEAGIAMGKAATAAGIAAGKAVAETAGKAAVEAGVTAGEAIRKKLHAKHAQPDADADNPKTSK